MEHKYTRMFVLDSGTTVATTGGPQDLTAGKIGIYGPGNTALTAAQTGLQAPYIYIAQGSGDAAMGPYMTNKIYLRNVTKWYGTSYSDNDKEQITYLGYDEVNDCLSPSISCDEEYTVTVRVDEHYINNIFQPYLTESVTVKAPCCDDCDGGCGSEDTKALFEKILTKLQASERLAPYVGMELVTKLVSGSPATTKYILVMQDPGTDLGAITTKADTDITTATGMTNGTYTACATTAVTGSGTGATVTVVVSSNNVASATLVSGGSGYKIGDTFKVLGTAMTGGTTTADDLLFTVTGTDSPEGAILDELRTMYADFIDAPTDIVITSDTDGDQDTNATGNIMFELTPSTGVVLSDLEDYNGIKWTENTCATPGDAIYACGIKFTGIAQSDLFNSCKPETTPLFANKVRFKVYVTKGPVTSMGYDLPNYCDEWSVKNTQEIGYLVGSGAQIAELERDFKNYIEPFKQKYINNEYNVDYTYFADDSLKYNLYHLTYLDPTVGRGFENKTAQEYEVILAVKTGDSTSKSAIETVLNDWLNLSPAYEADVNL